MGFSDNRIKNFFFCWLLAFLLGVSFRHFVIYSIIPDDCLTSELVHLDELVRGPIVYSALFVLDKIWVKFNLTKDEKYKKLPKIFMFASSLLFEFLQNNMPLINIFFSEIGINASSCLLGSLEDIMMDASTVFFYRNIDKNDKKSDES